MKNGVSSLRTAGLFLMDAAGALGVTVDKHLPLDQRVDAIFYAMDKDRSGYISFDEYQVFLSRAGALQAQAVVERLFSQLEEDNDDPQEEVKQAVEEPPLEETACEEPGPEVEAEAEAEAEPAPEPEPEPEPELERELEVEPEVEPESDQEFGENEDEMELPLPDLTPPEPAPLVPELALAASAQQLSNGAAKLTKAKPVTRKLSSSTPPMAGSPGKAIVGLKMRQEAVVLPAVVKDWKVGHVQQWLEHDMLLPQYQQSFLAASVDGLVLLSLNETMVRCNLGVNDELHCMKLVMHVDELRKGQQATNGSGPGASDYAARAKARNQALRSGWERGDGSPDRGTASLIDRARLEMLLEEKNKKDASAKATTGTRDSWNYQYSGPKTPKDEGEFEVAMGALRESVLGPGEGGKPRRRRKVPSSATSYEALALIKKAMWEAAAVLKDEQELAKAQERDSDLGSVSEASSVQCQDRLGGTGMKLLFEAFIGLKNNGARWLGANNKLTRLKLEGGIASLLHLDVPWELFDLVFNRIDTVSNGCLSLEEFIGAFGDTDDLQALDGGPGLGAMGTRPEDGGELQVLRCKLCQVVETLQELNYSLQEVFSCFDRNGSGAVSVSEFTSLMKLLLGKSVTKHQMFLMLSCIDESGDRQIQLSELRAFFYSVWASHLAQLNHKIKLSPNNESLRAKRRDLRNVIRGSFSRTFRDSVADKPKGMPGPFTSILERMGLGELSPALMLDAPTSPVKKKGHTKARTGRNELIRTKMERGRMPSRENARLGLPFTHDLSGIPLSTVRNEQALLEKKLSRGLRGREASRLLPH
ncbi:unnamed protein product [Chrysoparadoxa australica]